MSENCEINMHKPWKRASDIDEAFFRGRASILIRSAHELYGLDIHVIGVHCIDEFKYLLANTSRESKTVENYFIIDLIDYLPDISRPDLYPPVISFDDVFQLNAYLKQEADMAEWERTD